MTQLINTDKINNIVFFNPAILKKNEYKRAKYNQLLENPGNVVVYPNDNESEKKSESSFKKFRDELYKDIRSSRKFCDGLQALFVKDSLKECDFILRIESSQTRSKKINGFATLKFFRNSKSLYVDVICTNSDIKGTGTYMVNLLSKICDTLSLQQIKLTSATKAVPFYLKTEFECDPLCKMVKTIEGGTTSKTRRNKMFTHKKTARKK
jgi:hypothetical protein